MEKRDTASPELQLLMRRHHARHWESAPDEPIKIAVPINGAGSQTEWRAVTDGMLKAAKGFIETGIPPTGGELDLPVEPRPVQKAAHKEASPYEGEGAQPSRFRFRNPLRKWLRPG